MQQDKRASWINFMSLQQEREGGRRGVDTACLQTEELRL